MSRLFTNMAKLLAKKPLKKPCFAPVRILVAITGASGAIYTQRLLDRLDPTEHEVHVILAATRKSS